MCTYCVNLQHDCFMHVITLFAMCVIQVVQEASTENLQLKEMLLMRENRIAELETEVEALNKVINYLVQTHYLRETPSHEISLVFTATFCCKPQIIMLPYSQSPLLFINPQFCLKLLLSGYAHIPVSYTHLTLPTNREV